MEIRLSSFSQEAASKTKGLELRKIIEENIDKTGDMLIDFSDIRRFASPFFNNSFASLALKYGFEKINQIKLKNISTVGIETYKTSMDNAEMLLSNSKFAEEMSEIIQETPKKTED